jgi:N-acyl homoserine lactone hydrolase
VASLRLSWHVKSKYHSRESDSGQRRKDHLTVCAREYIAYRGHVLPYGKQKERDLCYTLTAESEVLMTNLLRGFFLVLFVAACDEPLRLPYITPELHNWPRAYKGVAGLKLHVFHTGTIEVPERLVYQGGSIVTSRTLDIPVFVIAHPRHGFVLFGTGLNRALAKDPRSYLGFLLTSFGKPTVEEGQDIVSQLEKAKLSHDSVRHVILPDLRFDHTGELDRFPLARAIVASTEHTDAIEQKSRELYLPAEYSKVREWQFISFTDAKPLGTFRAHQDLFGDGSVLLIDVTGATAGGLAVLVRLPSAPVILSGNLAWTRENYFRARLPGLLFDREAWWEKVWRLKKFKELVPELVVLPDHDWAAIQAAQTKDMIVHIFSTEEASAENGQGKKGRDKKPKKKPARKQPLTLS